MNKKHITFILYILILSGPLLGQSVTDRLRDASRSGNRTAPAKSDSGNKKTEKAQVPDMSSALQFPSVAFEDLISDQSLYFNPITGYFRPTKFHFYFLPEKDMEGKPMNYNNFTKAFLPYLRLDVVNKSSGQVIGKFYYRAEPYILPSYETTLYEDALNPETPTSVTLTEGSYSLDFFIGDNKIASQPFKVEKENNPDPYAPARQMYWMRGEWEQYGRITFNSYDDFMFGHYIPDRNIKIKSQSKWDEYTDYPFTAKLYRNTTMVGVYDVFDFKISKGNVTADNGKWRLNENVFYKYPFAKTPGTNSNAFLKKEHMSDGDYTIETEIFRPSGTIKNKYKFTIKSGQIISDPRADRSKHKDPLTFMEQGVGLWYLPKM